MKNIVKAIEAEQEYIQLNLQGEQPNIHDFLDIWGYSNLEEFHNDKIEYQLRNLDWTVIEQPKIDLSLVTWNIKDEVPSYMYAINTGEKYAFVRNGYENENELIKRGFTIVKFGYNSTNETSSSGLILSFDGDFRLYLLIPKYIDVLDNMFLKKLNEYFIQIGLNSVVDGNDILVDNKKVCGSATFEAGGMKGFVYQVTFTDHLDEINEICGERNKIPGFISQDVLTAYQLKDKFLEWLQ